MKKSEIQVGSEYFAKVNGKTVVVKVEEIGERAAYGSRRAGTYYSVLNLTTNRGTTFRSAQKFIKPVPIADQDDPVEAMYWPASENTVKSNGSTLANRIKERQQQSVGVSSLDHRIVEAYAGTGKTFTLIVGTAWAFAPEHWEEVQRRIAERINEKAGEQKVDPETFRITPSEEQQKVWDALAEGRGQVKTICYCAFNKSIVTEFGHEWGWLVQLLQERVGVSLQFATVNSLGNKVCNKTYGWMNIKSERFTEEDLADLCHMDRWELIKKEPVPVSAVTRLVELCKLTMAGWDRHTGLNVQAISDEHLASLCSEYDVDTNGASQRVYDYVRAILDLHTDPTRLRRMDFNDQNWLPVVNKLSIPKYDLIMVDEGQDLSRCKQEFCLRLGKWIFLVGDRFQSIYGFAGADVQSIPRMYDLLSQDGRRVQKLELTETRRCGKAIVQEAQRIVPGFKAHESNPEGVILSTKMDKYSDLAQDGDMVLCRVNAPLVSNALKVLSSGRKAVIRGRQFGDSLVKFVERLKADDVSDLLDKAQEWADRESQKEAKKKNPSDARLTSIQDQVACVEAFSEGCQIVSDVIVKMQLVFSGMECPQCRKKYNEETTECYQCKCSLVTPKGVLFSSVHRAKGLESKRVFILLPKGAGMPHPMAKTDKDREQEMNLKYVAITRAIEELHFVTE